jgi:hypothetical protein
VLKQAREEYGDGEETFDREEPVRVVVELLGIGKRPKSKGY